MILLLRQPDFGTVVMLGVVLFILLYLAGTPIRILGATFSGAVIVAAYLALGTEYRRQRLMTYLDPWKDQAGKGFQILQSFVGLHHGGLTGVGLGNGKEKLFYLPEAHNDFIFSVIGEEMGFLGVALLIITFFMFIYLGLQIAWRAEKIHRDPFGYLLASAITLSLGLQAFVNMAVVLGLLPTKGLNLPFVSYGGSSLLVDLAAVGILLSVARGPARE
jgi:cell division protein FtsW